MNTAIFWVSEYFGNLRYFSIKTYVVGSLLKLLRSMHNFCFYGELTKLSCVYHEVCALSALLQASFLFSFLSIFSMYIFISIFACFQFSANWEFIFKFVCLSER